MLTEDQIDELRHIQKELRAQAEIASDAWDEWFANFADVATELHKYNDLLKQARDIVGDPYGELGDFETEIGLDEPRFDEADAIDGIIEEETV